MGVINQLGKFSPNTGEFSAPLRTLLSVNQAWFWGPNQDKAFNELKLAIPYVLAVYTPRLKPKYPQMLRHFDLAQCYSGTQLHMLLTL